MSQHLTELAQHIGLALQQKQIRLTTAESCTGGLVAQTITSVPESSKWFDRGFVTYSNESKQEMLGVQSETIEQWGAASEHTVKEMAEGALTHSHAQISLAITGIAGPSGGTPEKPVGTIWFALAGKNIDTQAITKHFQGDRQAIRQQAVEFVLNYLLEML